MKKLFITSLMFLLASVTVSARSFERSITADGMMQKDGINHSTKDAGYMAEIIYEPVVANEAETADVSKKIRKLATKVPVTVAPLQGDPSTKSYQGMAIYDKYMVSLQNKGIATIYQMPKVKKICEPFKLDCYHDYNHSNAAAFGVEKYDKKDPMPVLYVSQAYKKTIDGKKDLCYVERLHLDGSSETVQEIMLDDVTHLFGYALQWTVDSRNAHLIGFGNTKNNNAPDNELRIIVFPLPKLSEGKTVSLKAEDAIECYTLQQYDDRYPRQVVGQGACVYDDCLIMPTGFGNEKAPSVLYVWDLRNKRLLHTIDLRGKLDHEMEDADFYKGDLYIHTIGAGVVKFKKQLR